MFLQYLQLIALGLVPAVIAVIFYLLNKYTKFKDVKWIYKQIIFGVVFGLCAILSTECGPWINGAQANVRDAAVLIAGLFFGWPAGLIAGAIGAIERGISVLWTGSTYTVVACCIATAFAGVYSALIRRYLIEDKRPQWFMGAAMAIVMEAIHMSLIPLTHFNDMSTAMEKVRSLTVIMMIANALSVLITGVVISILEKDKITLRHSKLTITNIIQRYLLITVICSFLATSGLNYAITRGISERNFTENMKVEQKDIKADLKIASDENMRTLSEIVYIASFQGKTLDEITNEYLVDIAQNIFDISEINCVDKRGIIVRSTNPAWINFDMSTGEQSSEFLILLTGTVDTYVQEYMPTSGNPDVKMKYAGVATDFGFIQVGYNSAQFKDDLVSKIKSEGLINNRHIGQTGFTAIYDESMELIAYPSDFATKPNIKLTNADEIKNIGNSGNCFLTVNESYYIGFYEFSEGLIVLSVQSEEEAYQSMYVSIYFTTFTQIYIYAILFIVVYLLIKKLVLDKLKKVNASLKLITDGNLNVKLHGKGNIEIMTLNAGINTTVDALKKYIEQAKEHIAQELLAAKEIQTSSLPVVAGHFKDNRQYEIYASMSPAKEVGGDFYDFYETIDDRIQILIADVSGKGIPAAMFMMKSKASLKADTEVMGDLGNAFTRTNNTLCTGNEQGMFVTAWQGGIDINTGETNFVNAGHNPPLIKRANGKFEYLKTKSGFVLAGLDEFKYEQQSLKLEPGDIIFLYTDGVTEATNVNNELFGEQRLLNILNSYEITSMEDLCKHVREEVDKFVGEADQFDDMTMLAFKYKGGNPIIKLEVYNAEIKDIDRITAFVEEQMEPYEPTMKSMMQINVAIDEIVSNIINHGYKGKKGKITISLKVKDDVNAIALRFIDEGIPYNPLNANKPDITLSAEDRAIGGLGIYMVKETMDEIKYRYEKGKNILTIYKTYK